MKRIGATMLILFALSCSAKAEGKVYYVSNSGSDGNDGRSPETPWRTLAHVNTQRFEPGDAILLKRGDCWREQLLPHSGSEKGHIRYGACGEGAKPLLLGSLNMSDPKKWIHEGGNIWATVEPKTTGEDLLGNPSFSKDDSFWCVYTEHGASVENGRDPSDLDSAPASYFVRCAKPGNAGSDIQLYTMPIRVKGGKFYRLEFRAKSTMPFAMTAPQLMQRGRPWTAYSPHTMLRQKKITEAWGTHSQFYKATVTADDARLTFFLGGVIPQGATFHLDSLTFAEIQADDVLTCDVGNIIFNGEESCGVKVWNESDLKAQGQHWYDEERQVLKLYSSECPGSHYKDIECALSRHMILQSNVSYVIYEDLALKYGAAHGVGGANTHHIIVRGCDFGYIGGADQYGGDRTVRFGNGVEFWANAHDNLVERCRFWEIYDAALTNQNNAPNVQQYNIIYRNNLIWNSEYSFEYWNRPENSLTHHIYFENNTCLNAGHGWGHAQRPDPSGRHLCFYGSPAQAHDIFIRNNIFFEATKNAFYAPSWPKAQIDALTIDHNCWGQAEGDMILLKDKPYPMARFSDYQSETGKEAHSMAADPLLAGAAKRDFHLTEKSPCINTGADVGIKEDFDGTPRPQGDRPDVGAYEFTGKRE